MTKAIEFGQNKASAAEIAEHLFCCDPEFVPPLASRVDIDSYAKKIFGNAMRFEAWSDDRLIGLLAAYCNDNETRTAYVTTVSVAPERARKGLAAQLLQHCIAHASASGMRQIRLEVAGTNLPAIGLYHKNGFIARAANTPFIIMELHLKAKQA